MRVERGGTQVETETSTRALPPATCLRAATPAARALASVSPSQASGARGRRATMTSTLCGNLSSEWVTARALT